MSRYWFDSFPDIDQDNPLLQHHVLLDPHGTPYGEPYPSMPWLYLKGGAALDNFVDPHAPYTTVSQNRGGIA